MQGLFVGISNPKALDFTMLALALLAALPYNGVIQTAANKLTYCPKTIYFASKNRHNVLKIKEESLLD